MRRRLCRLGLPLAAAALVTTAFAADAQAAVRGGGYGGGHGGCSSGCNKPGGEPGDLGEEDEDFLQPTIIVYESLSMDETLTGTAQCPDDTTITGGGFSSDGTAAGDSFPSGDNMWTATISTSSGTEMFTVCAVCLPLALAES
ncbi:hypothetical protein ACFYST_21845 [Kitasatospora sp. NPDC004614]|uniref:hypothetical protein n=1 Tax=unclassified Kitasatospora TaxID=2633591 RepID=UPI003698C20F